ncbi:MAG: flagellar basal body L-ring protein FlgH [Phycisphaerales bacterium]|nr:flagellar basal body L-ring protein FlgH [Planctomycetota bacterium]MCH8509029.1 flagellar basal body L-ring protein FlgH [Phycisphaerales bacterium]
MIRIKQTAAVFGATALLCSAASAQSLFLVRDHQASGAPGVSQPAMAAEQVSLIWVPEPEPRQFQKHDIITIIIDEVSTQTSSQSLETEQDSRTRANLNAMLNLANLLELRLDQGDTRNLSLIDFNARRNFSGEGDYERKDRFSARITATVLEVKPNGTLVLEASKRIAKDTEIQTIVLSGVVRENDITRQNTVLSSQMAKLDITSHHEGQVRDAAKKGFITRVLDTIFAF